MKLYRGKKTPNWRIFSGKDDGIDDDVYASFNKIYVSPDSPLAELEELNMFDISEIMVFAKEHDIDEAKVKEFFKLEE